MKDPYKLKNVSPALNRSIWLFKSLKRSEIKTPPGLTSLIGELYVYQRLTKLKIPMSFKGGQARYDLLTKNMRKIEVKTSTKHSSGVVGFGGIEPSKFDFLVCVELRKDISKPKFYIFTKKEAQHLPTEEKARPSKKGESFKYQIRKSRCLHLRKWDKKCPELNMINKNLSRYRNKWNKIKN